MIDGQDLNDPLPGRYSAEKLVYQSEFLN